MNKILVGKNEFFINETQWHIVKFIKNIYFEFFYYKKINIIWLLSLVVRINEEPKFIYFFQWQEFGKIGIGVVFL